MANTKKYISLDKLGIYDEKIKGVISAGDAATLKDAKGYTDESFTLANENAASLANTAAAGVQTKLDEEVARAQGKENELAAAIEKAQGEIDSLELAVGTVAEGSTVVSMIEAVDAKADQNIADIEVLEGKVAALEAGTYDDTEVRGLIADNASAISTLSQTHGTDKKALEDAIALKADKTALDAVSAVANAAATQTALQGEIDRAKGEEARIEGLVTAEASRAAGVEAGLDERLEKVEAFFEGAAEDEGEGESLKNALDTLVEIQNYIDGDGAAADEMVKDIAANAKAIEDMDAAYKAADETLQGNIDALTGVVNGKVAQGDFDTLSGKVTTAEGKISANEQAIAALQGEDTGIKGRLDVIEGKLGTGDGSVESKIATAKQEAIDAAGQAADAKDAALKTEIEAAYKKYADDEDAKIESRVGALESASATHALASDLTALDGRVTTAEGKIGTLESEMDAVEAKAAANEGAISTINTELAKKALDTDLTAAKDRITALETWHSNFVEVSEEEINALFGQNA
jgi:predicted  nucleic acid-binding Zn-ribbon protein